MKNKKAKQTADSWTCLGSTDGCDTTLWTVNKAGPGADKPVKEDMLQTKAPHLFFSEEMSACYNAFQKPQSKAN